MCVLRLTLISAPAGGEGGAGDLPYQIKVGGRAHAKKCKPRAERGREREKREESQSPSLLTAEAEGGVGAGCGADSQAS